MDKFLPRKLIKQLNSDIKNNLNINTNNCKIFYSNSASFLSIQFADLIAGSCFQNFERKNT